MLDWISPLGISRSGLNLGGLRVRRDKPARVFAGSPASDISAPLLNGARALLYASREFSWNDAPSFSCAGQLFGKRRSDLFPARHGRHSPSLKTLRAASSAVGRIGADAVTAQDVRGETERASRSVRRCSSQSRFVIPRNSPASYCFTPHLGARPSTFLHAVKWQNVLLGFLQRAGFGHA